MEIMLDGKELRIRNAAHSYLKAAMDFPDYYGETLDSLYDCLGDICTKTLVIITDYQQADEKIIDVFRDMESENHQLSLKLRK